jgi:hypothetical protein
VRFFFFVFVFVFFFFFFFGGELIDPVCGWIITVAGCECIPLALASRFGSQDAHADAHTTT